jgi:hypothetical protein
MLSQMGQKVVTVVLLLVCPSAIMMAERPTAMLYASGSVTLNGVPVANSTAVFDGDGIATAGASGVSINRSGSSLVVDPNSSIQYRDDGFSITKGVARVRTSTGMRAHWDSLSVIPKTGTASFDVSTDGNTLLVSSRAGSLTLTDGVETATLEPGSTARVSVDPQDQGPKPAATTRGEEKKHKKRLIIILLAGYAAAVTAIVVCSIECGGGGNPISPIVP